MEVEMSKKCTASNWCGRYSVWLVKKNGCHAGELAKLIFHTDAKMLFWLMGDCPAIRAEQVSLFGGVT